MGNYYKTLSDLRIAEKRKDYLEEKKQMLLDKIMSCTSQLKDDVTGKGFTNDKLTLYIIKVENLNEELEIVQKDIDMLKSSLKEMDDILKNISGIEERVFRLYYIESKTPLQISFIIPCSRATVFRYLKRIKQKL